MKVKSGDREDVAWSLVVNPLEHAEHRRWVDADVDLSKYAGRGRGDRPGDDGLREARRPHACRWGAPAVTVGAEAPLAIIYLVDTLRADHTRPYGYARDTTPSS